MKIYDNLTDPIKDLDAFLRANWAKLPEAVQAEVTRLDAPGNSQDRVAYIVECMYANRTKPGLKTKEARDLMASVAFYYGGFGLLYFRDGRGEAMANGLRRDNGEEGIAQTAEQDPDPLPQYVEAPEVPADPPAAAPGT